MKILFGKISTFFDGKRCAKLLVGGLAVILVLAIIGVIYQNMALAQDNKLYPPPGQLVDVGGYRLHLYCLGEGSPTVVLEAGGGGKGVLAWSAVQEKISATTRVCSYDRAGLGWSDPDPTGKPRISTDVAETLHILLHNAGINEPYLLVGHSAGGVYVRSFAQLFPKEVAGMILVDSAHENQHTNMAYRPEDFFEDLGWKYCQLLAPVGLTRLFELKKPAYGQLPMSDALYNADVANSYRTYYCRSAGNERIAQFYTDQHQSTPPQSLGDLPLIVLTVENGPVWDKFQNELASLSSNSNHIVVENGNHYLQFFQPDVVINAVVQMVKQVRSK